MALDRVVEAEEGDAPVAARHARGGIEEQLHSRTPIGASGRVLVDVGVVLPVPQRGEGGEGTAGVARPGGEAGEVAPLVTDVPDQDHYVGLLFGEPVQRGAGGGGHPLMEVG